MKTPKHLTNLKNDLWAHSLGQGSISRRVFIRTSLSLFFAATLPLDCRKSSTEPEIEPSPAPKLTAKPGSPTLTPGKGFNQLGFGSGRDGFLYVPQNYSGETATSLFVALHGAGGAANSWSNYVSYAEARGIILLAPDSRSTTWDVIIGDYGPDLEFIDKALQYTFRRCFIDPAHITLGGFSDGASYALSLGTSNGDLFSHLVAHSPGFFLPSDFLVGQPPIFISHGKNDQILPVTASRNVIVPALRFAGYDVTYQEFEGDHEVPSQIIDSSLDWFLGKG
jgi:phospholipase/carboxylesterase